jgi:uroporphyrinogen-III synthase
MNNWEHKRILVTRPAHQAQGLIHLLSGKGASVLLFPTLIIQPVPDLERLKKEIQDQFTADWLIFISPNAVDHVMPIVLEKQWLKDFTGRFATVGIGTRDSLSVYGVNSILFPTHGVGAAALLETLRNEDMKNKKVVIFRGDSDNPILEDGLTARGANIFPINCYQRRRSKDDPTPLVHALAHGHVDVIVTTSGDGLQSLVDILPTDLRATACKLPVVVVSKRVQDLATTLGFSKTLLADDASDEAIASAIEHWYDQGASRD